MKQRVVALFMAVLLVLSASSVLASEESLWQFNESKVSIYGGTYEAKGTCAYQSFSARADWTNTAGNAYIEYTTYTTNVAGKVVPAESGVSSKPGYQASLNIDIPTTIGGYVLVQVELDYYSNFMDNETVEFEDVILRTGY